MIEDVHVSSALASSVLDAFDVGVSTSRTRRRFTAAYKLKILAAATECTQSGDIGALLRREGLYASHLAGAPPIAAGSSPVRRGAVGAKLLRQILT